MLQKFFDSTDWNFLVFLKEDIQNLNLPSYIIVTKKTKKKKFHAIIFKLYYKFFEFISQNINKLTY